MTNDLRALVEKWRADANAAAPANTYGMFVDDVAEGVGVAIGLNTAADELQAALDAQAGMVMVSRVPDVALLVSMATCLSHGFGLYPADRQESMLADMRKLHDEVVGLGYYSPANRDRYTAMLPAAQAGPVEGGGK